MINPAHEKTTSINKSRIAGLMRQIIETGLGLDIKDPNLRETPERIAKMYIDEWFRSLYEDPPKITVFPNEDNYNQMIVSGPIHVKSVCSHHFVPFTGICYVGYIPKNFYIGLSKLSRIVHYFMRMPQLQERMTDQIATFLDTTVSPLGCGVYIKAQHACMTTRGVEEPDAFMITTALKGIFLENPAVKQEFLSYTK